MKTNRLMLFRDTADFNTHIPEEGLPLSSGSSELNTRNDMYKISI
jgi:hypothetical protein